MRTFTISIALVGLLALGGAPVGAAPLESPTSAPEAELPDAPLEAPVAPDASASRTASTSGGETAGAPAGDELRGLFRIRVGECSDGGVTQGSYFRMAQPGGNPDSGPFVDNGDSPCGDGTYTPLSPGADGGLLTGAHQAHPDPAFGGGGDALADRITAPQSFFGTDFATATNPTDPQTGTDVDPPVIVHDGDGGLDGDLRAFAAAWNGQHFNQGSPKPDGSQPGNTAGPTGTYDPDTGAFTLTWSSHIQGGPFNGFTGVWHLEGEFEPGGTGHASGAGTSDAGSAGDADAPPDSGTAGSSGEQLPDTGGGAPLTGLALMAVAGAATLLRRRAWTGALGSSR